MARVIWLRDQKDAKRPARKKKKAAVPKRLGWASTPNSNGVEVAARSVPEAEKIAPRPRRHVVEPPAPKSRTSYQFDARLDLMEIEDRERPDRVWPGRAVEIGPSHIVLRCRRMCHLHRNVLIAIHMLDDRPVPLFGTVIKCIYEREGLHVVEVALLPLPDDNGLISEWIETTQARDLVESDSVGEVGSCHIPLAARLPVAETPDQPKPP